MRGLRYSIGGMALCLGTSVSAGPIAIAPTTITLDAGQRSASILIENVDDQPIDLQFRSYRWDQKDGVDTLTATSDILVSPAITTVAPHSRQVFRILRQADSGAPSDHEQSYRLRLNQIPKAVPGAIGINFEFSLPVFVTPKTAVTNISVTVRATDLCIANTGSKHVKFRAVSIRDGSGRLTELTALNNTYILGHVQRCLKLVSPIAAPEHARLIGFDDNGPVDEAIAQAAL